jgi:carbamoyl-phosphate synthase small subunit
VRVGVLDFGAKHSILRELVAAGAEVQLLPGRWEAEAILEAGLHGLVVSNGPGDPAAVLGAVRTLRKLVGRLPILGICLGHQLLALALGGRTYKLPFGHHGANHPVRHVATGEVWITAQNHNYAVDGESLPPGVEVSLINLTDGSVEGIVAAELQAEGVQFHPEAGPGPHDALGLFRGFVARCQNREGR